MRLHNTNGIIIVLFYNKSFKNIEDTKKNYKL